MQRLLISGKLSLAESADLQHVDWLAVPRGQKQDEPGFVIAGHGNSYRVYLRKVRFNHCLDLRWVDAISLDLDQQIGTSVKIEKSILVAMGKITSSQPAIGTEHIG